MERAAALRAALTGHDLQCLAGDLHRVAIGGPEASGDPFRWRDAAHGLLLRPGFWLSRPDLEGRPLLKAVMGNPYTTPQHLQRLADLLGTTTSLPLG